MQAIGQLLNSRKALDATGQRDSSRQTMTSTSDPGDFCLISSSDERYAGQPNTPAPTACEFCGATLYRKGFAYSDHVVWSPFPDRCTCPDAMAAHEQAAAARKWYVIDAAGKPMGTDS